MRKEAIDLLDNEILSRYSAGAAPDLREAALAVIERILGGRNEEPLPRIPENYQEAVEIFAEKLARQARNDYEQRSAFPEYIRQASAKIISNDKD